MNGKIICAIPHQTPISWVESIYIKGERPDVNQIRTKENVKQTTFFSFQRQMSKGLKFHHFNLQDISGLPLFCEPPVVDTSYYLFTGIEFTDRFNDMPFGKENPVQFFFNVGSQKSWIKPEMTETRLNSSVATNIKFFVKPYLLFILVLFFSKQMTGK